MSLAKCIEMLHHDCQYFPGFFVDDFAWLLLNVLGQEITDPDLADKTDALTILFTRRKQPAFYSITRTSGLINSPIERGFFAALRQ